MNTCPICKIEYLMSTGHQCNWQGEWATLDAAGPLHGSWQEIKRLRTKLGESGEKTFGGG